MHVPWCSQICIWCENAGKSIRVRLDDRLAHGVVWSVVLKIFSFSVFLLYYADFLLRFFCSFYYACTSSDWFLFVFVKSWAFYNYPKKSLIFNKLWRKFPIQSLKYILKHWFILLNINDIKKVENNFQIIYILVITRHEASLNSLQVLDYFDAKNIYEQ